MLKPGTKIVMTKGYRDIPGRIIEKLESRLEFYLIRLDNGIQIIAGPSAFVIE